MFTGIVQTTGVVRSIRQESVAAHLVLDAPDLARPIPHGASISVNGVCLTVTDSDSASIHFDMIPETLGRSTLGALRVGDRANLERSVRAGDGLEGHLVQGHVDGTGRVQRIQKGGRSYVIIITAGESLMPFMIPKGSVAIDGVSLTIASVQGNTFSVALIPTTLTTTTLGSLRAGDRVNIETDILARTVVTTLRRWAETNLHKTLSVDKLRENGW